MGSLVVVDRDKQPPPQDNHPPAPPRDAPCDLPGIAMTYVG